MPSKDDIEKALKDMRTAVDAGKFQLIPRGKNMHTLAQLGITLEDAKDEVYTLTPADYFQGPEPDRDFPGTEPLWMFKKNVAGQIIYIKFKTLYLGDGQVKLVSFHIDNM